MGSSWKKEKRGVDVTAAIPAVMEPVATADPSIMNCVGDKVRDNAWKVGNRAIDKEAFGTASATTGGCF
jgi:hypothetical protein